MSTGTLLHLLAFVGRHEATEWLLNHGAYVHTKNHVSEQSSICSQVLLPPLPQAGSTPLHVAALRHQTETIKVLRFHHADVYTENDTRQTALDFGQDDDDVKEILLSNRFSDEVLGLFCLAPPTCQWAPPPLQAVEDEYLGDRLPALVERVTTPLHPEDLLQALYCLRAEIRVATSSMTSVPKPLKLLREHFASLEEFYEKMVWEEAVSQGMYSLVLLPTANHGKLRAHSYSGRHLVCAVDGCGG